MTRGRTNFKAASTSVMAGNLLACMGKCAALEDCGTITYNKFKVCVI